MLIHKFTNYDVIIILWWILSTWVRVQISMCARTYMHTWLCKCVITPKENQQRYTATFLEIEFLWIIIL
jgi:hypothetical protein